MLEKSCTCSSAMPMHLQAPGRTVKGACQSGNYQQERCPAAAGKMWRHPAQIYGTFRLLICLLEATTLGKDGHTQGRQICF